MLLVILNIFAGQDWILILLVVLLLFGGKKIPELMRGLGQGVREFNAAKANIKTEIEEGMKQPSQPVQVPTTQSQTTTTTENK
jgi:sec-independent protein translocase protein TatA